MRRPSDSLTIPDPFVQAVDLDGFTASLARDELA